MQVILSWSDGDIIISSKTMMGVMEDIQDRINVAEVRK